MDPPNQVVEQRREKLLRDYAAGKVSWSALRRHGFDDYVAVLGGLGALGLRPPVAPLEVLDRFLEGDPAATALLLFEDSDIARRQVIIDERVSLITTGDFLRELEAAGLIQ